MTSRETIYAALFALVKASTQFNIADRKMPPLDNMPSSLLPSVFQVETNEDISYSQNNQGLDAIKKFYVDLFIYASTGDNVTPHGQVLNNAIDAIEAALAPDRATRQQTLGNTVTHARINGKIEYFEGNLENKSLAIVPIEILVNY